MHDRSRYSLRPGAAQSGRRVEDITNLHHTYIFNPARDLQQPADQVSRIAVAGPRAGLRSKPLVTLSTSKRGSTASDLQGPGSGRNRSGLPSLRPCGLRSRWNSSSAQTLCAHHASGNRAATPPLRCSPALQMVAALRSAAALIGLALLASLAAAAPHNKCTWDMGMCSASPGGCRAGEGLLSCVSWHRPSCPCVPLE